MKSFFVSPKIIVRSTALVLCALGTPLSHADEAASNSKLQECIKINRIDQTRIVDEKTVLFYYSKNEIYKSILPNACVGMQLDDTSTHKSSTNNLCAVDYIIPMMRIGSSYVPRGGCGLGKFERIDKAAADKLIADAKKARD